MFYHKRANPSEQITETSERKSQKGSAENNSHYHKTPNIAKKYNIFSIIVCQGKKLAKFVQ
jgi:hypothetical protein